MRLEIGKYYFVELGWFEKRWQYLIKVTGFSPQRCLYDLLAGSERTILFIVIIVFPKLCPLKKFV